MRVLFYRYGSICEPFILTAFAQLGREMDLEVSELSLEMENKNCKPSEAAQALSTALFAKQYDLVFSVNFFPTVSDVCNIFHIPYAGWTVDSPVLELYSRSAANPCNYIFVFDRCQYEEFSPMYPGHVYYLPLASDPDFMQSVIHQSQGSQKYCHDISFVGSLYTEKCAYDRLENLPAYVTGYLDGLMDAQQKINGMELIDGLLTKQVVDAFKAHMPEFYSPKDAPQLTDAAIISQYYIGNKITTLERQRLLKLVSERFPVNMYTGSDTASIPGIKNMGRAKTLTEMPLIFHGSTINLNITSRGIRSGIPLRIWDILSCGGFVLTNYQAELPDFFSPGESLDVFVNEDDLIDKCVYYLEHPAQAKEIAENGLTLVSQHHTYRRRIEQMLDIIFLKKKGIL